MKEIGLEKWLRKQERRVEALKECAKSKRIKHCSECKEWPCKILKREPLKPA